MNEAFDGKINYRLAAEDTQAERIQRFIEVEAL